MHFTQLTLIEDQIIEVTKEDDSGWWQVGTKPKTPLYISDKQAIVDLAAMHVMTTSGVAISSLRKL
jgi:hypothetical protein